MLSFENAIDQLLQFARPLRDTETVQINQANGRVLAEAITAGIDVPPADNSMLDGYAIATADLAEEGPTRLRVAQRIPAGSSGQPLSPDTCARIFTGAPIPPGADAIVAQENARRDGEWLEFDARPAPGEDIRRAGEDIRQGSVILEQGRRLRPQDLGLAASVGCAELTIYRRLKVATFSTGDELADPGEPLAPGQIYNSNRYTLTAQLANLGCEVVDLGRIEDTLEVTRDALRQAATHADLVITTGGVSVGEEDHVKHAVENLGRLDLWKVRMKPGKPLAYGAVGETPFIGLPGNPVSAFATFCLFARPYILRSQGVVKAAPLPIPVSAGFDWTKAGERREFVRARLDASGRATLYPHQGSGVLTSTVWADGLVMIPEQQTIAQGDRVTFYPFAELLN